jgi:hypothetical protein
MIIIRHRRNTDEDLAEISTNHGAEIDIRSQGEHLVLHHEPYKAGNRFDTWLENYDHQILILNVKEEGLEDRVLELMEKNDIENFFFLDQSFPFLVKTSRTGESRCAVRVSEFENINTAMTLAGKVDWVWIDCFTRFPLDKDSATRLKKAGFKLCIVSPELHGRMQQSDTDEIIAAMNDAGVVPDAVCTKFPERWEDKSDN